MRYLQQIRLLYMESYFNIRYEFDKGEIWRAIDRYIERGEPTYICVVDGVILSNAHRNPDYSKVINGGAFSICDSSYVPIYLRLIYGIQHTQYSGSEIFNDAVQQRKYKMCFLGGLPSVLKGLKRELSNIDPRIEQMLFHSLPFKAVEDFDYPAIAQMVNESGAEIIWVALGAPKQEIFMSRLSPYLDRGVVIAIGAVYNFRSGIGVSRAPRWMIGMHLEFAYRIFAEPRKQIRRCWDIVTALPIIIFGECKRRRCNHNILRE